MKLRSLFYDSSINLSAIKRMRFIIALILGIASALIIYSFFFVLVETFRVMGVGFDGLPQILSYEDRNYYNLFFAALSVVFGNSVAFNYIFSKPQNITHRFNSKRKRLLNDNVFLSFNFSYWFAKLGLSFGIFYMCCMTFNFLPYFKQFSYLLILVLYLESIKNFSFFLRNKNRLKFVLIHVFVLGFLAFLISKITVIDYQKIDSSMLYNNPIVDLPKSNYSNSAERHNYPSYFFKLDKDSTGMAYVYYQKNKLEIEDIGDIFSNHGYYREELIPFTRVYLEANRSCNIYDVKRFERALFQVDKRYLIYVTRRPTIEESEYRLKGIKKVVTAQVLNIEDRLELPTRPPLPYEDWVDETITDTLFISVQKNVKINNKNFAKKDLKKAFRSRYKESTLFLYQYTLETSYQDYIDVLSAYSEAIDDIRKEHQTIFEESSYYHSKEYRDEQSELRRRFQKKIGEAFH